MNAAAAHEILFGDTLTCEELRPAAYHPYPIFHEMQP